MADQRPIIAKRAEVTFSMSEAAQEDSGGEPILTHAFCRAGAFIVLLDPQTEFLNSPLIPKPHEESERMRKSSKLGVQKRLSTDGFDWAKSDPAYDWRKEGCEGVQKTNLRHNKHDYDHNNIFES